MSTALTTAKPYKLNTADKEEASWLTNAGVDDTKGRLAKMTGTPCEVAILQYAIAQEEQHPGGPRSSRMKPMQAALRKFTKSAAPLPLVGESKLPDWDRARRIAEGVKYAARMTLAAKILLGHELLTLKTELGFLGRGRRPQEKAQSALISLNRKWDDWTKAELGVSEDTADRLIETYEAAKSRVKRLGGEARLVVLLETPARKLDEEGHKTLAAMVDKLEWGESQTALLEEWGIYKRAAVIAGGDTSTGKKKGKLPVEQLAFAFFHKVPETVAKVEKVIGNLRLSSDYTGYLAALPVSSDDPEKPSLTTLQATLKALLSGDLPKTLADIEQMIASKQKAAQGAAAA